LNGASLGGWTDIAAKMEQAGADAIELNVYFVPGDLSTPGVDVEERHLAILNAVKAKVSIPVAMKIGPYFSSPGNMIKKLDQAGADAIVMFNRFFQPDITLSGSPHVVAGYDESTHWESRLPRTWIAATYQKINASIAGSTGVETADDVLKYLMSGADVVMTTSAVMRHGAVYLSTLLGGLKDYLTDHGLTLAELRGMLALPEDADADQFARNGYVAALEHAKKKFGNLWE
jgi:dihydroorotate dehydrogenase (fumarate)